MQAVPHRSYMCRRAIRHNLYGRILQKRIFVLAMSCRKIFSHRSNKLFNMSCRKLFYNKFIKLHTMST